MKLNKEWHLANKWHIEHARNCSCRPLGGKILKEIKKRGINI